MFLSADPVITRLLSCVKDSNTLLTTHMYSLNVQTKSTLRQCTRKPIPVSLYRKVISDPSGSSAASTVTHEKYRPIFELSLGRFFKTSPDALLFKFTTFKLHIIHLVNHRNFAEALEGLSITFASNGKHEFVPSDQASPTTRSLFIISTHKLVVSHNFLSTKIVLSSFYLLIFYFQKF